MINQCAGCQAGMPIIDFIHVDKDGNLFMVCTKKRYRELDKEENSVIKNSQ